VRKPARQICSTTAPVYRRQSCASVWWSECWQIAALGVRHDNFDHGLCHSCLRLALYQCFQNDLRYTFFRTADDDGFENGLRYTVCHDYKITLSASWPVVRSAGTQFTLVNGLRSNGLVRKM